MDAAVRRADISCISVRPSWVVHPKDYVQYLAFAMRDPGKMVANAWSYVDAGDLADALVLASVSQLGGHEVFYVAAEDNLTGRPLSELVREHYGERVALRALARPDASGVSSAKALRLLGYKARRSWRDFLNDDGTPRVTVEPDVRSAS